MTLLLIIGVVGLLIVIASLLLGELFDGLFDGLGDTGGVLSGPVIGAFLAAFGFGGALILSATSASAPIGALGGLASGIVVGGIAMFITRSLISMPTDEPVRTTDLVGQTGTVVTPVPANGLGEVSLVYRGQPMKLGARSSGPIASGTRVTITAVTSPSSVLVAPIES